MKKLLAVLPLLLLPSTGFAADTEDLYKQLVAARKCTGPYVCRFEIGPVNFVIVTGTGDGLPTVGVDRLEQGWRVQVVGRCVLVSEGPLSKSKKLGAVSSFSAAVFNADQSDKCINGR